jgi:chromosome segregation ATPase
MDERKKTIADLEAKKQEAQLSISLIQEDFGEALFSRIRGREELSGNGEEYLALQKEIADSEDYIALIEADTLRLKELEDEVRAKEQENAALGRDLAEVYSRLGKLSLNESEFAVLAGDYKRQIDVLISRIGDQEEKLAALEEKTGTNVFTAIGRNAQGMLLRTLLSKNQQSLEKLYETVGEKLVQAGGESLTSDQEIVDAIREAAGLRENAAAVATELAALRGERRKISDTFGAEGGPVKRIQGLEKHIAHIREELKLVYRRFGEAVSAQGGGGSDAARYASILTGDDKPVLEKIELLRSTAADYETQIEKLKAAIAIDDEKAFIGKMKKSIEDYQDRIKTAESAITEIEGRIAGSEKHIKELERLL